MPPSNFNYKWTTSLVHGSSSPTSSAYSSSSFVSSFVVSSPSTSSVASPMKKMESTSQQAIKIKISKKFCINPKKSRAKTIHDFAREFQEDLVLKYVMYGEEPCKGLICRFCYQSVAPRRDRIREHLSAQLHLRSKKKYAYVTKSGKTAYRLHPYPPVER